MSRIRREEDLVVAS
jgi:hypothetical protein